MLFGKCLLEITVAAKTDKADVKMNLDINHTI